MLSRNLVSIAVITAVSALVADIMFATPLGAAMKAERFGPMADIMVFSAAAMIGLIVFVVILARALLETNQQLAAEEEARKKAEDVANDRHNLYVDLNKTVSQMSTDLQDAIAATNRRLNVAETAIQQRRTQGETNVQSS